jgi:hypothetical protein
MNASEEEAMVVRVLVVSCLAVACAPEWHPPEVLDDRDKVIEGGQDTFPEATMAGSRAIVVWGARVKPPRLGDPLIERTYARFSNGVDPWSTFAEIGDFTQRPQLVGSADGTAMALVTDGFSRFDGDSFSAPVEVEVGSSPRMAMDGSGNVLVVGSSGGDILATRYDGTTGWGAAAVIGSGASPRVAMSEAGAAVVAWSNGGNVWLKYYSATDGFSAGVEVLAGCAPSAVGVSDEGEAVVVADCDGASYALRASTSFGLTPAALLVDGSALSMELAVNASGAALAAWYDFDNDTFRAASAEPGDPFGASVLISSNPAPPYAGPALGVSLDASGDGHMVYSEADYFELEARRFEPDTGFSDAESLEGFAGKSYYPSFAGNANGDAVVVWNQSGEATLEQIWAARFY